jgi:GNAT superfamily N-acetyltransferase
MLMKNESKYNYQVLASAADASFSEVYALYVDTMPPRERKTEQEVMDIARSLNYTVLLMRDDKKIIGYSILFNPASARFFLLEYMAIHSDYRNMGCGSDLFKRAVQDVSSNENPIPCLLEIDSDRERSEDRELRKRRQRFYKKIGRFKIENLHYVLPLHGEGPPPEMDLMIQTRAPQTDAQTG